MPIVSCKFCGTEFKAKGSWLKKGFGQYCSNKCRYAKSRTGSIVKCHTCSKSTYKSPKALLKSKSGKFFCSKSCQTIWRNTEFKESKHANWKNGAHAYRRILEQSGIKAECCLCRSIDKRILAVHHIDYNHFNNDVDNLAWLCHNCHHLVHHDSKEYDRFMAAIV